jgi:hypothetical protein
LNRPFPELMDEHQRLERLLLRHQVGLVEGRMVAARTGWNEFRQVILGHIRAEEAVVLPEYEARVTPQRGGDADIFRREHHRLQRFVDEVSAWLDAWDGLPWPATEVIHLVERQRTLKEILEHHDQREAEHLYAGLEKGLSPAEQQELVTRFRSVEAQESPGPREGAGGGDAPLTRGPAGAALLAAVWLTPLYDELVAGSVRPRRDAPWAAARRRLEELSSQLSTPSPVSEQVGLLHEMAELLDDLTPMNCFPVGRASQVHACWQLLHAAGRAAEVAAGTPSS